MYNISREYWFAAAHRLDGHPKCGRLHGHNYKVVVTVFQEILDSNKGWIMDFGDLDKAVKPVMERLDHHYIISENNLKNGDPYAALALALGHGIAPSLLEHSTAENLAKWIHDEIERFIYGKIAVEVWETYKSCARYETE